MIIDLGIVGGAGALAGCCIHDKINRLWIQEFFRVNHQYPKDRDFPRIFHGQWPFQSLDEKGPLPMQGLGKEFHQEVWEALKKMPTCDRWMLCCISAQAQGFLSFDEGMEKRRIKVEDHLREAIRKSGWVLGAQALPQKKPGPSWEGEVEFQQWMNELIEILYQGRVELAHKEKLKDYLVRGALALSREDHLKTKSIAVACTELDLLEDLWARASIEVKYQEKARRDWKEIHEQWIRWNQEALK